MQMVRGAKLDLLSEKSLQPFHSWQIIYLICS